MKELLVGISNIPIYGLSGVAGFICGMIYLAFISRKINLHFNDVIYVYVWAAVGAMIGAKLLYILIELPEIINTIRLETCNIKDIMLSILSGGFVFYGGLFGGLISVIITCRYFKYDYDKMLLAITPAMPLAHAFGRMGCAVVGCCYGLESHTVIAIVYRKSQYAPNGVGLFPVQLVEAAADLVIFGILVYVILRKYKLLNKNVILNEQEVLKGHKILDMYLLMYAVLRFILEFLRGDSIRGHWMLFSTSQWISIVIILYVFIRLYMTDTIHRGNIKHKCIKHK